MHTIDKIGNGNSNTAKRTEYYIIRYGNFATNGNIKLLYGTLSLLLGVSDYMTRGSSDCLVILVGSTTIWSGVECYLHLSGTRIIKPMKLILRGYTYTTPLWVSLVVQGLQEGGLITTLGLYFGDRIWDPPSIFMFHVFLLFSIINVCSQTNLPKSSKRLVNTNASMGFIGFVTTYDIYVLATANRSIYNRQLSMLLVMIYFSAWWTCATWWVGSRGVEVIDPNVNLIEYRSSMTTFMVFTYDVVFEIGFAYLFFYNMFIS